MQKKVFTLVSILLLTLTFLFLGCKEHPETTTSKESAGQEVTAAKPDTVLGGSTVHLLLVGDPFALALENARAKLEKMAGGKIAIEVVGYNDVRKLTLLNSQDEASAYDLVSFDVVWMGEYGTKKVLLPLDELIGSSSVVHPDDFLEIPYQGSSHQGTQFGLPIQPHSELLWYRKDLFEQRNLQPPVTTQDVLEAAEFFTIPEKNQYGICWNAQRGQALGQSMAHFYAAFGQPLLDESGRPNLNTPKGVAAAKYALALIPYSPPDILTMAWDQRTTRFAQGGSAMTYGWGARAYLVEEDQRSKVTGKVGYLAAPHAPGQSAVTPIGTWSLGIPVNIGPRQALAWRFLEWLSSSDVIKIQAEYGNGGQARYSVMQDPSLQKRYPVFATMERLGRAGELADWMRPAVPQWPALADILGTVYHDMLLGKLTPEQAAAQAQEKALALFSQEKNE